MFVYSPSVAVDVIEERVANKVRLRNATLAGTAQHQLLEFGAKGAVEDRSDGTIKIASLEIGDQLFAARVLPAMGAWHRMLADQECVFITMPRVSLDALELSPDESNVAVLQRIKKTHREIWAKIAAFDDPTPTLNRVIADVSKHKPPGRTPAIVILLPSDGSGTSAYLPHPGLGFVSLRSALIEIGLWSEKGPSEHVRCVVERAARIDRLALEGADPAAIARSERGTTADQVRAFLAGGPLAKIFGSREFDQLTELMTKPWVPTVKSPGLAYLLGRLCFSDGRPNEFSHGDPRLIEDLRRSVAAAGLDTVLVRAGGKGNGVSSQTLRVITPGFDRLVESLRAGQTKLPRILLDAASRPGLVRAVIDGGFRWDGPDRQGLAFEGNHTICKEIRALLGHFRVYPVNESPTRIVIADPFDLAEIIAQRLTLDSFRLNSIRTHISALGCGTPFPEESYVTAMQDLKQRGISDPDHPLVPSLAAQVNVTYATLRNWMRRTPDRMTRRSVILPLSERLLKKAAKM